MGDPSKYLYTSGDEFKADIYDVPIRCRIKEDDTIGDLCSWTADRRISAYCKQIGNNQNPVQAKCEYDNYLYPEKLLHNIGLKEFRQHNNITIKDPTSPISGVPLKVVWAGYPLQDNDVSKLLKLSYAICSCQMFVLVPQNTSVEQMKDPSFKEWYFCFLLANLKEYVLINEVAMERILPKYIRLDQLPHNNRITRRIKCSEEEEIIWLPALPPQEFEKRNRAKKSAVTVPVLSQKYAGNPVDTFRDVAAENRSVEKANIISKKQSNITMSSASKKMLKEIAEEVTVIEEDEEGVAVNEEDVEEETVDDGELEASIEAEVEEATMEQEAAEEEESAAAAEEEEQADDVDEVGAEDEEEAEEEEDEEMADFIVDDEEGSASHDGGLPSDEELSVKKIKDLKRLKRPSGRQLIDDEAAESEDDDYEEVTVRKKIGEEEVEKPKQPEPRRSDASNGKPSKPVAAKQQQQTAKASPVPVKKPVTPAAPTKPATTTAAKKPTAPAPVTVPTKQAKTVAAAVKPTPAAVTKPAKAAAAPAGFSIDEGTIEASSKKQSGPKKTTNAAAKPKETATTAPPTKVVQQKKAVVPAKKPTTTTTKPEPDEQQHADEDAAGAAGTKKRKATGAPKQIVTEKFWKTLNNTCITQSKRIRAGEQSEDRLDPFPATASIDEKRVTFLNMMPYMIHYYAVDSAAKSRHPNPLNRKSEDDLNKKETYSTKEFNAFAKAFYTYLAPTTGYPHHSVEQEAEPGTLDLD
jgi:hypothetical protein